MSNRKAILVCALLFGVSLAANAQTHRDSSNAFYRRFSIGVGLAWPYPDDEPLYTDLGTFEPPTSAQLGALWRNAFAHITVPGVRHGAFPARIGFSPIDRLEVSLGYWNRSGAWDEDPTRMYIMRMTRFFGNVLYRPAIKFSSRFRPVGGVSVALDEREHEGVFRQYFYQDYITCNTQSVMASVVLGSQMAAGQFLFGFELNFVLAAHIKVEYSGEWGSGNLDHWMDPGTSLRDGYALGPITVHMNYTFK